MRASLTRLASAAISACVVAFATLEGTAMLLYPGGTWWDATTRGHRFWQNYLCDLEWRVALDGQPNLLGSRLAVAALLVLDAGMAAFWVTVPQLFAPPSGSGGSSRFARFARPAVPALGVTSAVATVGVALMPSERFGALHGVLVTVAGAPGLAAALLAVAGLAAGEPRPRIAAWLGGATLALSALDYALYVSHFVAGSDGTPVLPAVQKLALGFLLAWISAVAFRARASAPPARPA